MSRFLIIAALDGKASAKFPFNSAKKALAKAVTFEGGAKTFAIRNSETGELVSLEDLRKHAALER